MRVYIENITVERNPCVGSSGVVSHIEFQPKEIFRSKDEFGYFIEITSSDDLVGLVSALGRVTVEARKINNKRQLVLSIIEPEPTELDFLGIDRVKRALPEFYDDPIYNGTFGRHKP